MDNFLDTYNIDTSLKTFKVIKPSLENDTHIVFLCEQRATPGCEYIYHQKLGFARFSTT